MARATASNLVGVDWSPVAVAEASRRTPDFLPPGRAHHIVGDLAATGLPDACSDVVICMDAVFFTPDRVAATTEVARILRPGGRYLFPSGERTRRDGDRHSIPDWTPLLRAGDLNLEHRIRVPKPRLGRSAPPSCETSLVPASGPSAFRHAPNSVTGARSDQVCNLGRSSPLCRAISASRQVLSNQRMRSSRSPVAPL